MEAAPSSMAFTLFGFGGLKQCLYFSNEHINNAY
jgi:hypothetical protein